MARVLAIVATGFFLLAGCGSGPLYQGASESELDREASSCHNGACRYELALAYFKVGANAKGWAYIDLSARDGYPSARAALINAGRPVPPKDSNAAYQ